MNQDIDDGIPSASMDPKSKTIAYNIDSIEKKQVESYSRKDCVGECDCTYYPFSKVWVCRGCCTEEDLIWLP